MVKTILSSLISSNLNNAPKPPFKLPIYINEPNKSSITQTRLDVDDSLLQTLWSVVIPNSISLSWPIYSITILDLLHLKRQRHRQRLKTSMRRERGRLGCLRYGWTRSMSSLEFGTSSRTSRWVDLCVDFMKEKNMRRGTDVRTVISYYKDSTRLFPVQ